MAPKLLTVADVARTLKRNPRLIYRWIAEGRLRGAKYGHAVLIDARDLTRFQRELPERRSRGDTTRRGPGGKR